MRVLRGLQVFCAWVNHTDVKANNTFDAIQQVQGVPAIVHHLIDFGASLGSDSDAPKNARFGHEYMIEKDKKVLLKMAALGLYSPSWERADYPGLPAVGRFEAETFQPEKWTSNYPNAAFLNLLPDDGFWAAKQVMAFTRDEVKAVVATGQYSDPRVLEYIVDTLMKRREKIGRYYFNVVLPLDRFEVNGGTLRFEDLAVKHNLAPARDYKVQWFHFNNSTGERAAIAGAATMAVPRESGYVAAEIRGADENKLVRVYVRGDRVVGVDRTW
jgi:hypothetical protein